MDKLKNKKLLLFLIGIALISFIFGCFFTTILSKNDQLLVKEYIDVFMKNIYTNNLNYSITFKESLISNFIITIVVWLLGISVIGIPIILFFYFFKAFTLGFSLSAFILSYKSKGIILSILYIFPNEIIKFLIYTLIVLNAIKISKKLIYAILNKETINFNKLFNKYFKILLIALLIILFTIFYETYVIPFIFSKTYFIIK